MNVVDFWRRLGILDIISAFTKLVVIPNMLHDRISIVTISHPWQRDTGKYAAQGPNIMSPEGPRMLPEGRRAELEARGQHHGARGRHNVARGRHISSGPRPGV